MKRENSLCLLVEVHGQQRSFWLTTLKITPKRFLSVSQLAVSATHTAIHAESLCRIAASQFASQLFGGKKTREIIGSGRLRIWQQTSSLTIIETTSIPHLRLRSSTYRQSRSQKY